MLVVCLFFYHRAPKVTSCQIYDCEIVNSVNHGEFDEKRGHSHNRLFSMLEQREG